MLEGTSLRILQQKIVMNFVDNIALSSGLKSRDPFISDSFFPIVPKRYITISTENHQSKQWDHFQEFVNLIKPILDKEDIKIIEIGENDIPIQNVICLKGATGPNHWSYIIKNSMLHVGPESLTSHLASLHGAPQVILFSNTSPHYAAPRWSGKDSPQSFVCAELKNSKPSFLGEENPKTINSIPAEKVCSSALKLLGLRDPFHGFDVLDIGLFYQNTLVEVVPDFLPDPQSFANSLLNIRMDYHFNEDPLIHFANKRKITIITEDPINKNLISHLKPSIEKFFFKVDQDSDLEYAEFIRKIGIPTTVIQKKSCDPDQTKLKFFDWPLEDEISKKKKDLDNLEKVCDTTRYKSSKHLFSKGKKYSSRSAYLNNIESHEDQLIIDDEIFWEEADYYKLYNLNRNDQENPSK
jgi:hypothetical protein